MVTSPTTSTVFHPKFLKLLTRFHKKSTHRNLLRTLTYKTQEKIINNGGTTHCHARPQIPSDPRDSHSNLRKSKKNFTKKDATTRSIGPRSTKPKNCKPKNGLTRHHRPAMTNGKAPQNCANLLTILEN